MREIKFRAWDSENNEMIQVYGAWFEEQGNYHETDLALIGYFLMQYTGLKDKSGKEIYEGDIIKIDKFDYSIFPEKIKKELLKNDGWKKEKKRMDGRWIIEWLGAGFCLRPIQNIDMGEFLVDRDSFFAYLGKQIEAEIEIIGNIFENKNLIKPK